MTLNKSLVCLAIASLSIPAMAAPVTTEGAGVGKHGDVIAAVTFDGGRERQKFCVHGIIGARQTGASNEHEHQTQFS